MILGIGWLMLLQCAIGAAADEPTYWRDLRPVLRKHCTACHNAKNLGEPDVSGGVALDSYEAVLKGTKRRVIHPGDSRRSLLVKVITAANEDRRMPQGSGPLPAEAIALIRRWIDSGAREGERIETPSVAVTPPRRIPKRDVILPTAAVPPRGLFGSGQPAKLQLVLRVGPLAPVTAVAFSPDGRLLAAGSYRQVTIWDLETARPVKTLTNVLGAVNDVRFSPDGKLLAVAGGQPSAKGDLRLYRTAGWQLLASMGGHEDVVFSVAFHPSGRYLVSASFDKTVRLWDVERRKLERVLKGHSDLVYAVAFSPDGTWLVSASKDRSVKLLETSTGKSRVTFSGMDQDVLTVAVSPDGKRVVSSGLTPTLLWWDPQTGQRVRSQGGHAVAVHELCFSKDGKWLASAGADNSVRLWNGSNGNPVRRLDAASLVYAVALSPDGRLVAGGSFDGLVRLWSVPTGRQLVTLLSVPASEDHADWLALTPEGYTASSPGLVAAEQWRMAGQSLRTEPVELALHQDQTVVRAMHGEKLTAPKFNNAIKAEPRP
jgi:WD40 repeat protein